MSSENKRLTGACVPAVIDLFEDEPKSESVGLPSRNGSTKVHRINLSPSLPFSEDSEKGVLCSLVHSANEVAALCAASLQPEAFYLPAHQILYKLILEFVKDCKPIDFISLKQGLIDRSLIDEIGGPEYLSSLFTFVPCSANASHYIQIVQEKWLRRKVILECRQREKLALDNTTDPSEWAREFETLIPTSRVFSGESILDLSNQTISADDILLGERFLCRGGGMFVVAPSGQGKSSMTIQMAILWGAGLPAFDIKPACPLRISIIQAEDDKGDCIEMARMINHLKLTDNERSLVHTNTVIYQVNGLTGDDFLSALNRTLEQHPSDIVLINPFTAYLGGDEKDTKTCNAFLRSGLNPILSHHGTAAVIIHHTPKTNFNSTENYKSSDWMYRGAGAAVITNWARAYLTIDPSDSSPGVYRFIAAKRGKRIGWDHGEVFYAHSQEPGNVVWVRANQDQIAAAKAGSSQIKTVDLTRALSRVPMHDPEAKVMVEEKIRCDQNLGRDLVRRTLKRLEAEGKIFTRRVPNPGKGRSFIGWAKTPEPEVEEVP